MSPPGSHIKNCEGINTCEENVQVNKFKGGESRYKVSIGEPSYGSCCRNLEESGTCNNGLREQWTSKIEADVLWLALIHMCAYSLGE